MGVNKETLRRRDRSGKFKSPRNPVSKYRMFEENAD